MKYKFLTGGLMAAFLLPATAQAAVLTCTTNSGRPAGGCQMFATAPTAVGGATNNVSNPGTVRYFAEQTKIVGATLAGTLAGLGITVSPTQAVASDYFNFNPAGLSVAQNTVVNGVATFSGRVIAVIFDRAGLAATSATSAFGRVGTTYNSPLFVGLETLPGVETISFSGNQVNFRMVALSPGDNFRVLTAVPEPSTWMMLLFGFGLAGYALRSRRGKVAVSFS
jgi:hypothetical protein